MRIPIALVLALVPATAAAQPATPVIAAQGVSVLKAPADQASVSVAVDTRDVRAPEARRLAAAAMTSVLAALKAAGVSGDAVWTTGFSLNPDYEYVNGRQRMRGFIVVSQVRARIDDIDRVADVLDAVGALSLPTSSTVRVANLQFDLKDRTALERQALQAAVEDAVANARAMAAGAGAGIGRIVRIDQGGRRDDMFIQPAPMPMMSRAGDEAISTPIAPSEIEVRATVLVTVEIR
jgi:uncharacterized protein YggE